MTEKNVPTTWKSNVFVAGGLIGLIGGLVSAYLYTRTAEENNTSGEALRISNGDLFKLTLALVALARQISDLAARGKTTGRR